MGGVVSRGNGRRWRIWYIDRHGKRRWGTGHADKRASQKLADELEQEERRIREGLVDPGTKERQAAASVKPTYLVDLWRESIINNGSTEKHARHQAGAVLRVLEMASVVTISNVDPDAIGAAVKSMRDQQSIRTGNHALAAVKQFFRWLYLTDRIKEVPRAFGKLKRVSVERARKRQRRALSQDELGRLIATTEQAPDVTVYGMTNRKNNPEPITGPERALLYRLAVQTGLRANEIRTLTASSFELDDLESAWVVVEAAYSKRKRRDRQVLHPDVARDIKAWIEQHGRPPRVPSKPGKMIKADLERAGISYIDNGRVCDFHALRATGITHVVRRGVDPATAQRFARHSDVRLTLDVYTHTGEQDLRRAIGQNVSPDASDGVSQDEGKDS